MNESVLPAIQLCPGHAILVFAAPSGWTWHKPRCAYYNLWLVLEGRGILQVNGAEHQLAPGSICVLPPAQEVTVRHDARRPVRNFSAHFTCARNLHESAFPLVVTQPGLSPDLRALALQAVHAAAGTDELGLVQAAHLVSAMLCVVARGGHQTQAGPYAARLRGLGERIRLHPEQPWSRASIAAELGLSPAQAGRCFQAHFGMPPTRFAISCRMERARQMLIDTDLSITEIAGLLGYADLFYFSRHLKAVVGCAPSGLRREALGSR